jgi:hypothetical protein
MSIDDRIRAALHAAADDVREADLTPMAAPNAADRGSRLERDRPTRPTRWFAPWLATAAAVVAVAGTAAYLGLRDTSHRAHPVAGPTPPIAITTPAPTSTASTTEPSRSTSPSATTTSGAAGAVCYFNDSPCFGRGGIYEALWPFASLVQARQWDSNGGSSPWHADAGATALLFTQNVLGFKDITRVTATRIDGQGQAHIGVGYQNPAGAKHTAATLHLVRYTTSANDTAAPWEVVGSDDTDFSLERPAYGLLVHSPMTVGGHITGVDENITVSVRGRTGSPTVPAPIPAGGDNTPWSRTVAFTQSGVLLIVASTGGHVTAHERFAIQGVHTG